MIRAKKIISLQGLFFLLVSTLLLFSNQLLISNASETATGSVQPIFMSAPGNYSYIRTGQNSTALVFYNITKTTKLSGLDVNYVQTNDSFSVYAPLVLKLSNYTLVTKLISSTLILERKTNLFLAGVEWRSYKFFINNQSVQQNTTILKIVINPDRIQSKSSLLAGNIYKEVLHVYVETNTSMFAKVEKNLNYKYNLDSELIPNFNTLNQTTIEQTITCNEYFIVNCNVPETNQRFTLNQSVSNLPEKITVNRVNQKLTYTLQSNYWAGVQYSSVPANIKKIISAAGGLTEELVLLTIITASYYRKKQLQRE